jgi:hypothetical protein
VGGGRAVLLATWSVYFAVVAATAGIDWSPELWTGTIMWACLLGLTLSLLMQPPVARATPRWRVDRQSSLAMHEGRVAR